MDLVKDGTSRESGQNVYTADRSSTQIIVQGPDTRFGLYTSGCEILLQKNWVWAVDKAGGPLSREMSHNENIVGQ